ncbi:MAG: hypothetical protein WC683_03440 [bacterium]
MNSESISTGTMNVLFAGTNIIPTSTDIAGVVAGMVVLISFIFFLLLLLRKKRKEGLLDLLKAISVIVIGVPFFIGLIILGVQIHYWFLNGTWISVELLYLVSRVWGDTTTYEWLLMPTSWFGLHKAVFWIFRLSLPWSLIIFGGIIFLPLWADKGRKSLDRFIDVIGHSSDARQ